MGDWCVLVGVRSHDLGQQGSDRAIFEQVRAAVEGDRMHGRRPGGDAAPLENHGRARREAGLAAVRSVALTAISVLRDAGWGERALCHGRRRSVRCTHDFSRWPA